MDKLYELINQVSEYTANNANEAIQLALFIAQVDSIYTLSRGVLYVLLFVCSVVYFKWVVKNKKALLFSDDDGINLLNFTIGSVIGLVSFVCVVFACVIFFNPHNYLSAYDGRYAVGYKIYYKLLKEK